ncbi:DUF6608 family protein [Isobaculum melis]|uniref:DUF3021 domain-containing protein n=1 Tax=Isobaculum melis TaxID=142588 RepID=A0A1H9UCY5_9LACT|nr:DUF6608 family protein [Isobaculum melis]SES07209.1 hypothetical protein SAMN04488559_1277 [Isobaculum melis]
MKAIMKEMGSVIAVSYTVLSITLLVVEWISNGIIVPAQQNLLMQFGFTVLFVGILYLQQFFESISPLVVGLIQLIVAEAVVMLVVYLTSFFTAIHPDGYRDLFVTTLIPFMIGALIYYGYLFCQVRQNNRLLKRLQDE